MTKRELINKLENLPVPDNTQIIVQKDAEGNDYSPLSGAETGIYIPNNTYSGFFYSLKDSFDDVCMDEDEWEQMKRNEDKKCIVLWPIN